MFTWKEQWPRQPSYKWVLWLLTILLALAGLFSYLANQEGGW